MTFTRERRNLSDESVGRSAVALAHQPDEQIALLARASELWDRAGACSCAAETRERIGNVRTRARAAEKRHLRSAVTKRSSNPPHRSRIARRTMTLARHDDSMDARASAPSWANRCPSFSLLLVWHLPSRKVDLERSGVDQRAILILIEDRDASRELLRHPLVVIVEERDVLAARRADAGVARGRTARDSAA